MPRYKKRVIRDFTYCPTVGVRKDFKRLMKEFVDLNTHRYEEFCKLWRKYKMEYLYLGRASDREAREFIEEVTSIALEYFLPPYQFLVRVGGLYLLYGIYQIQPLLPKVKIRLTLSQWKDMTFFEQQARQQGQIDIVYIYHRLFQENAFHICYSAFEHDNYKNDNCDKEEDITNNMKEDTTTVNQLFNFESLEQLSYFVEKYQQTKIELAGPNAIKPDKSLDLFSATLTDDLVGSIQAYKESVKNLANPEKEPSDGLETLSKETGDKRKLLKALAYNDLAASKKTIQFVETELCSKVMDKGFVTDSSKVVSTSLSKSEEGEQYWRNKKCTSTKFSQRTADTQKTPVKDTATTTLEEIPKKRPIKNFEKCETITTDVTVVETSTSTNSLANSRNSACQVSEFNTKSSIQCGRKLSLGNASQSKSSPDKKEEFSFQKVCISDTEILVLPLKNLIEKLQSNTEVQVSNIRKTKPVKKVKRHHAVKSTELFNEHQPSAKSSYSSTEHATSIESDSNSIPDLKPSVVFIESFQSSKDIKPTINTNDSFVEENHSIVIQPSNSNNIVTPSNNFKRSHSYTKVKSPIINTPTYSHAETSTEDIKTVNVKSENFKRKKELSRQSQNSASIPCQKSDKKDKKKISPNKNVEIQKYKFI